MSGLSFDEATHTYRYGGRVVPGVTSILAPLNDFNRVPPQVLDAARDLGTAVHLACELDDLGDLDEAALDPALAPYLRAWRAFCADSYVRWYKIEIPEYHRTLGYAGTPDRYGAVQGDLAVVDLKSSAALYPSVGPQLAAYAHAIDEKKAATIKRIAVQLKADGTYATKTYTDPSDWPVFCSLLTLRNWCSIHSIQPNYAP